MNTINAPSKNEPDLCSLMMLFLRSQALYGHMLKKNEFKHFVFGFNNIKDVAYNLLNYFRDIVKYNIF